MGKNKQSPKTRASRAKQAKSPQPNKLTTMAESTRNENDLSDNLILKKLNEIGDDIKGIRADITVIQTDMSDLKVSLTHTSDVAQEALEKANLHDQKFDDIDNSFCQLKNDFDKLKQENIKLQEHLLKNECQERRNNLIIEGIPQKINETDKDCLESVYEFLEKQMKIDNVRDIKVTRCHRKPGKPRYNPKTNLPKPHAVIVKLHYYPDKDLIWRARNTLKDTSFWLSEDFPVEIAKRRQTLNSIRKKAVEQGSKARLSVDKLFVDGEMFTVDTLYKLPPPLQLSETFTKRTELYTAFYSKHSPLSNFKPAKFTKNGIKFEHSEQYYQHYKAMENHDKEKAQQILNTVDPLDCYRIGRNVKIGDKEDWEKKSLEIMYDGCLAKFQENPELADFLISTGDTVLLEASPFDRFWGLGMSMYDKNIFKPEHWPEGAKNWLGKILSKVRAKMKK